MQLSKRTILLLLPALLAFSFFAYHLNFVQDDAYISYRYVANYLNGDGLVYNIGERVEGFTNFAWVVWLLLLGGVGIDYIIASQIIGFLFGLGIILLTYLLTIEVLDEKNKILSLLPAYLVGLNMSLAYWAPAGLETAAFAFFVMFSLLCFIRRSRWLIFGLLIAVWIRPEGGLAALLFLIVESIQRKGLPKYSLTCGAAAFILSLPFVGFKLIYYGSILPNPFYAKTGISIAQLSSGLEYAARFLYHYGFFGIGLLVPLIFYKRLSSSVRTIWLLTILYVLYIILVGGDVLKVHRFFIPLMGTFGVLIALSLSYLTNSTGNKNRILIVTVASIILLVLTVYLPFKFVSTYNDREILFTEKMRLMAQSMKETDNTNFSVALPTIGIFGYELIGHDIIDMLGLTDSTIARHAESEILGMETTWKERKHNSAYILHREPDYIIFSTGIKPSAPAEKALLLYPAFIQSYRTVGWYFQTFSYTEGSLKPAFKKVRPITGELSPVYPLAYVDNYKVGLEYFHNNDFKKALGYFNLALKEFKNLPPYFYLSYQKAKCHMLLQDHERAQNMLNSIVRQDSLIYEAHWDLYTYAMLLNQPEKAEIHLRWLAKLVPWYVERVKENTAKLLERNQIN